MGRRFSATLGFGIGLGAASLLNLDFYNVVAQRAMADIATAISQADPTPRAIAQASLEPNPLAQAFNVTNDCTSNKSHPVTSLRPPHLQNLSLLQHVPPVPQRLSWYSISQGNAIANAPRRPKVQPAVTHWNTRPPAWSDACGRQATAIAPNSLSLLNQQSHFILALASLKQKNDWLLQPLPEPPPVIHSIWRGHETVVLNQVSPAAIEIVAQFE